MSTRSLAGPGRPAKVSDAELVALAVCQAAMGISSDRQFLGLVGRVLPGVCAFARSVAVQPQVAGSGWADLDLDPEVRIGPAEIDTCLERQNLTTQEADAVFIYTGSIDDS